MILNRKNIDNLRAWQHATAPGGTLVIEAKDIGIIATTLYGQDSEDRIITLDDAAEFYYMGYQ